MTSTEEARNPLPGANWASGDIYESYVGRWSRLVAREFVPWLAVPAGANWLDVGCGTGALSATILANAAPQGVTGIDPSVAFIAFAGTRVRDTRARFEIGDARALPGADASVDAAVSGLVLNFVPDPGLAVKEMARVVRPGGSVGAYVWDYADRMEMMRHFWDAAIALDPAASEADEGRRSPICQPGPLADLFRGAALRDVEVRAIDIPTVFRNFDDYWTPFLGGGAPAPRYALSLDEKHRTALRETIRAGLSFDADGSIHLIARAWAVRGRR
jgi:SAM-dependent methyltransferase